MWVHFLWRKIAAAYIRLDITIVLLLNAITIRFSTNWPQQIQRTLLNERLSASIWNYSLSGPFNSINPTLWWLKTDKFSIETNDKELFFLNHRWKQSPGYKTGITLIIKGKRRERFSMPKPKTILCRMVLKPAANFRWGIWSSLNCNGKLLHVSAKDFPHVHI